MIVDFLVRLLPQECLICMDRVSRQQSSLRFWNIFLDVFEKVPGSLVCSCFRFKDFCCKAILSMCPRTPLVLRFHRQLNFQSERNAYHLVHCFLRLVDHCSPSLFIYYVQVAIGDYAEYFDNNIIVHIQTSHLCRCRSAQLSNLKDALSYLTVYPYERMAGT
jgi:hypothetical protein